jgi:Tfp pilus assembly protein PilX
MKQILEERKERAKKKGTVLFTVVGVMMVLVVFLISTLILTSAANRRSYYTYYESQAQYAAQAALDAITNSAYSNNAFYNWVSEKAVNGAGQLPITVDFADNSGIQFTNDNKVVECFIERVPDNYIWDVDTSAIHAQRAWKITATASVGKGRNQADYTVCNYIYEAYRPNTADLGNSVANKSEGNTYSYTYKPPADEDDSNNPLVGAMTRIGMASTNNNVLCLGPNSANVGTLPFGRGLYDKAPSTYSVSLDNIYQGVGNGLFVSNLSPGTYFEHQFQKRGEGFVVYGNFTGGQRGSNIYANLQNSYKATTYNELNYIYVDGKFSAYKAAIGFVKIQDAGTTIGEFPVNVYAGCVEANSDGQGISVYGDMYLYDPDQSSVLRSFGPGTALYRFTDNQVNGTNNSLSYSKSCGNLYCNNKSLEIHGNNSNQKYQIMGDLYFTNPVGTLNIQDAYIDGNVYCACPKANVTVDANKVTGQIYYDQKGTNIYTNGKPPSGKVTEQVVTPGAVTYKYTLVLAQDQFNSMPWDQVLAYQNAEGNKIAYWSGDLKDPNQFTAAGIYHEEVITGQPTTSSVTKTINYDFSLFPFAKRLDEIFTAYYRWDLKAATKAAAEESIKNDYLIKESVACGHTWSVNEFKDANGVTYFVPYTTPKNTDNKFIPANENALVKTSNPNFETLLPEGLNYTSLSSFCGGTQADTCPAYTMQTGNVKVIYHTTGAVETSDTLTNAVIINESCTINCTDLSGKTIFIDPSYKGYSDSNPMRIVFEGTFYNAATTIIVNNTASYDPSKEDCYGNPVSYASQCQKNAAGEWVSKYAGRSEVLFYWPTGFGSNKDVIMYPTGAYGQMNSTDRKLNVVSNPIYPKTEGALSAIKGDDLKYRYSYELVPNLCVFSDENGKISFQNAQLLYGVFLMPKATISVGNSAGSTMTTLKVDYREEFDCGTAWSTKDGGSDTAVSVGVGCVGSVLANIETGSNNALVVYIGDGHRSSLPGSSETVTGQNSSSNDLGQTYKDWFNNNYQGAN